MQNKKLGFEWLVSKTLLSFFFEMSNYLCTDGKTNLSSTFSVCTDEKSVGLTLPKYFKDSSRSDSIIFRPFEINFFEKEN